MRSINAAILELARMASRYQPSAFGAESRKQKAGIY
jgi:hypothetical protein